MRRDPACQSAGEQCPCSPQPASGLGSPHCLADWQPVQPVPGLRMGHLPARCWCCVQASLAKGAAEMKADGRQGLAETAWPCSSAGTWIPLASGSACVPCLPQLNAAPAALPVPGCSSKRHTACCAPRQPGRLGEVCAAVWHMRQQLVGCTRAHSLLLQTAMLPLRTAFAGCSALPALLAPPPGSRSPAAVRH